MPNESSERQNAYAKILLHIFRARPNKGAREFSFSREELVAAARTLNIALPKNVGDVLYSFRYRTPLPGEILAAAGENEEWLIEGAGRGQYRMRLARNARLTPQDNFLPIKIPDATPEIIARYAQSDEQALLARLRYNRLIDIFLGVAAYSLQNPMRTTVSGVGQIEIDEVYVAVDKNGVHYIIPVQAKSGSDSHSAVQIRQDMRFSAERYPALVCRPVAAQFVRDGVIALLELAEVDGEVGVVQERHYQLVDNDQVRESEIDAYKFRT